MKTTSNRIWLKKVPFLALFLISTINMFGQDNQSVERLRASYQQTIDRLDASWDERSYNMYVPSSVYNQATRTSKQSVPYALGVYSFKGNVLESPNQKTIDKRLKTLAALLRKTTDEFADVSKQNNFEGSLSHLKPLLMFLAYTVSDRPVPIKTLNPTRSTLKKLNAVEWSIGAMQAEALTQIAEKLALTPWTMQNKHLAYKYLAASVLNIPALWTYLEPDFTRMVREGGSTTDTIIFAKLHMDRAPFFKEDSRIWKQAPRFWPSQLTTLESAGDVPYGHVSKVELSDTETKVTMRYTLGGHELWFRIDASTVLIDHETKDVYHVRRVENRIPLGKTFVVVGCEDKAIEYTLVFPPLQKSLKAFVLDDYRPAPTSESAKKRFYRKYNIMSDGGGSSDFIVYKLSDFVK